MLHIMTNNRRHPIRVALSALLGVAVLVTAGCGSDSSPAAPQVTTKSPATLPGGPVTAEVSVAVPGSLAADFADLQRGLRGSVGMAIMPVAGTKMVTFGDWTTGPAWSTIKVPLAIAVSRRSSAYNSSVNAAITASDNAAADALWSTFGDNADAAAAVEGVLREGGDATTTVPTVRTRSDASIYGQAEWALADQVRFAAQLPCLPQSERVVGLMQQIVVSHRWGLGAFTSAEFKGGWGPDTAGKYLVRQFGLIDSPSGRIAVAFAAKPDSGAFADGMTMLDKLATLLSGHLDELAGGHCP